MQTSTSSHGSAGPFIRWAVVGSLVAGLAACGGGGGSSTGTVPTIDVTALNRDTLSHAVAVGILALSPAATVPMDISAAPADRKRSLAVGYRQGSAWSARVIALLTDGRARSRPLRRPLAVSGPFVESCALGGSVSATVDDRDDSGTASVGDVLSIVFDDCQDSADETVDGEVSATYLTVDESPPAVSARLVLTQLAATTSRHALTLDGTVRLDFSMPDAMSAEETLQLSAEGPVVAQVSTHLPYSDTVTLHKGWTAAERYDASVDPVPGNAEEGQTTVRVSGGVESEAAGGVVRVSTVLALTAYGEDPNPRSGAVQAEGRTGTLQLTALSVDAVRIELDADDDGSWEAARTETWDWLL